MRLPRWLTPWRKATDLNTVTPIRAPYGYATRFGWVGEAFGGMFQGNLTLSSEDQLAFGAVFACISLRSRDIAKLPICVRRKQSSGVWVEDEKSSFYPVLRRPNRYQTRLQFIEEWVTSKLSRGNTYIFKDRDRRGMVSAMYVLNPDVVQPMVASDGSVYYSIGAGRLAGFADGSVTVPASEIIHDRGLCLFHPLVGVSPLFAAGLAATQGTKIQNNSSRFFENMSRPGGHLTAPGTIADVTAERMRTQFESGFSGVNVGRLLVTGDGLKFEPFTIPAEDAQLIEQLKWTGEDVARVFHVPPYKIGLGSPPSLGNVSALNTEYYQQALQNDIESIELLLDSGLGLTSDISAEFDLEHLLRMDWKTRAEVSEIEMRSGIVSPNEARAQRNREPVTGGEKPFLQQQNWPLPDLATFHANELEKAMNPPTPPTPPTAPPAAPQNDGEDTAAEEAAFAGLILKFRSREWPVTSAR